MIKWSAIPHHAHIVQISGESYWFKDKRKTGTNPARSARHLEISDGIKFQLARNEVKGSVLRWR